MGPRKIMPIAVPLILVSHMSEIVPAPTHSPEDPAGLLRTLMTISIPMEEDRAARVLNSMHRASEEIRI
ncbi:hypothetical protein MMC28_011779, partial [Mycoblastus sanguinarius]|nr:hypothetical protein [Mycoblastus sanguinarius]